jgi:hypothetical protein
LAAKSSVVITMPDTEQKSTVDLSSGRGRFIRKDGTPCTWKERLIAACDYYGTFCGRWHDNSFWKSLRARADAMTEEEAYAVVQEYERDADESLRYWQLYQ